jgi:hypothetical protein
MTPSDASSQPAETFGEDRGKNQQRTFDAFLRTQPYETRSAPWQNRGLGPPIDFINTRDGIGVELTEWRGQEQSQWVEERDRFRYELFAAIEERGSSPFAPGGKGYTAQVYLKNGPPSRANKAAVIACLLDFLHDFMRTDRSRFDKHGIATIAACELPVMLQSCINSITIYIFPAGNLGIVVHQIGTPFDPNLPRQNFDVALLLFGSVSGKRP